MVHILRRYGIRPHKGYGQHFLIKEAVARRIVDAAELTPEALVLEIGPGTGALTQHLISAARQVCAVEIDPQLVSLLEQEYASFPNLEVRRQDILDLDIAALCRQYQAEGVTVVGNLPYNITGPILERLLLYRPCIVRAVVMVQEEVGERLTASPGTKAYGALSVIIRYTYRIRTAFRVAAGNFMPRPAVQSAVLVLEPHAAPPVSVRDADLLFRLVKSAFQQRRKMLHHAVARMTPDGRTEPLSAGTGIDLSRRGETLSLDEFALLANAIWEQNHALSPIPS
jgi:16S rRNA (adenine1518-N6/adenine1519-N6)-dimethyltransferase